MKRVTLLVPENTVSLIVASLVYKENGLFSMGQLTLGTETIKQEPVVNIEKDFLEEREAE